MVFYKHSNKLVFYKHNPCPTSNPRFKLQLLASKEMKFINVESGSYSEWTCILSIYLQCELLLLNCGTWNLPKQLRRNIELLLNKYWNNSKEKMNGNHKIKICWSQTWSLLTSESYKQVTTIGQGVFIRSVHVDSTTEWLVPQHS
jgi:hypothetical protein